MAYDIFITYRREGGRQYARNLQLMLQMRGYTVFFDYDELTDGPFPDEIKAAIEGCTIYMVVLTKGALDGCVSPDSWVRREIETALEAGKRIVPVDPDGQFDGVPAGVPEAIRRAIEETQHSEVHFGQTLRSDVDLLVARRIKPHIPRSPRHRKVRRLLTVAGICVSLLLIAGAAGYIIHRHSLSKLENLKESVSYNGVPLNWSPDATATQIGAIGQILESMQQIKGGTFTQGAMPASDGSFSDLVDPEIESPAHTASVGDFAIGRYEVTVGQWNAIMDGEPIEGDPDMPVANISYNQARDFATKLYNLTALPFRLPTEAEWEYAARGGSRPEGFTFAGGNKPDEVAWYAANSGGKPHPVGSKESSTANLKLPTSDDLFNMSGNVAEWTSTPFRPYDKAIAPVNPNALTVRGGSFESEPYELTVTHRDPMLPADKSPAVGFRLVIADD